MHRLLDFPVKDQAEISALRLTTDNDDQRTALGLALARAGCSNEASYYLRPNRKLWSNGPESDDAKAALAAQTWWNKSWRQIARSMQAGQAEAVLALVADHALLQWDQPALLLHLASIAGDRKDWALARQLLRRVIYLADRGLPKQEMKAFEYSARAGLIDVLASSKDPVAALTEYRKLTPNHGNAMAHELLGARLLALSGQDAAAMVALADILVTARTARKGYSRDFREDFVAHALELAHLRDRADWSDLLTDPSEYSKRMAS